MNHTQMSTSNRERKWRRVNIWPIKGPLLGIALLLGIFSELRHWGAAPFVVAVAVILPIIGYRDFWDEPRFWITVVLLGFLQVPVALYVGPTMDRYKLPFMLAFGIADCLLVASVLWFVCSAATRDSDE